MPGSFITPKGYCQIANVAVGSRLSIQYYEWMEGRKKSQILDPFGGRALYLTLTFFAFMHTMGSMISASRR